MRQIKICILSLSIIYSCSNTFSEKDYYIQDFVLQTENRLIDTSKYVTFSNFKGDFDTVPTTFGYLIFNRIINPIPIDSCTFRKLWTWNIDTINLVRAIKTNIRLDPKKELSNDTYFFLIDFISIDSMRISATIYLDLENEWIGTYYFPIDSLKVIKIDDSFVKVPNLKDKLKMHWH